MPTRIVRSPAECRARELAAEAHRAESADPAGARDLYRAAAEAWLAVVQAEPESAYAATQRLRTGRKGGLDRALLLGEARAYASRFPEDPWLCAARAWVSLDFARESTAANRLSEALEAIREAAAGLRSQRSPEVLAAQIVRALADLARRAPAGREDGAPHPLEAELRDFLLTHGDALIAASPATAPPAPSGPARKSPRECAFYLVRRIGLACRDGALLERFLADAVRAFPRDEWFAEAWIRAAWLRGDLDEARRRAEAAFRAFPRSSAIGVARAGVAEAAGDPAEAVRVLESACLAAPSVWAWRSLATAYERQGRAAEAAEALAVGLSFHRVEDVPKVWRLHHRRALLLRALGRADEAALEAWLARASRAKGGWALRGEQVRLLAALGTAVEALDREEPGAVRRRALADYRRLREAFFAARALEGRVTRCDGARGFGFVRLADGREAYFRTRDLGRAEVARDARVKVVVVPSYDAKRGADSWQVVWLRPEGAADRPPREAAAAGG